MLGRLDSAQFPKFNTFENLIDLVPFGAAEENLSFARTRETGKYQKVFLGGIYTWYDPFASLDCLKIIWRKRDDIKFVFVRFPFDIAAVKKMEGDVLEYADRIGVQDNIIFTNWVSYEERSILYADIDIALVVHRESLEAALSFRTRILDFLSFGIPVIANKGGDLEKELEDHACGIIVNNNNPEILAEAVLALVEDRKKSEAIIARGKTLVKNKYLWEKVIEPLDKFCRNPSFSARIGSVSNATTIIGEDESVIQQSLRTYKTYGALRLLRKGLKYFMKTR
jgi:glycosyltransferase involved in cell wall biosynthesis